MQEPSIKNSTLIVIPAFNEEKNLGTVITEIRQEISDAHLVIINDGSTDFTERVALNRGETVLSLPFNLGVGAAMRLGFKYAQINGYARVIQIDADGQHIPAEVSKIEAELSNFDVVIGSRFAESYSKFNVSKSRKFAMFILGRVLSRITRTRLTDVSSGFRGANAHAISIFARAYPPEYLGDTIESLVIANNAGLKIKEVPVQMRERLSGYSSQSTLKALSYTFRALLVIALSVVQTGKNIRHDY